MATRKELLADLRAQYGNMLNIGEATEAIGYSDRNAAKKFFAGLPLYDMGKEKKFLAIDVAKRIDAVKVKEVNN